MTGSSLKLRLALLVGILGLAQGVAVLLFSHSTFERELDKQHRALLRDKAQEARRLLQEMRDQAEVKANAFRLVELVTGRADLHMAVAGAGNGPPYVSFSPEAAESLQRLRRDTWQTDGFLKWHARTGGAAMLSLANAGTTSDGSPYELVLTIDRSQDVRVLRELLFTAATLAPFALAIAFFGALVIVSLGLRPLETFRLAVEGITARSLRKRIEAEGLPDELRELAEAFNMMLNRLDEAVTRLSQFSDDLAHEMRTPLATLLGRTQVALSKQRGADELVEVMEGNVEELQRLARLVSDMLFLARAEHAREALDLQDVDLRREAVDLAEFLELTAQQRGIAIQINGRGLLRADRGLVRRAMTNLLSNAIRHADPGSTVRILISVSARATSVEVTNQGRPIDPDHAERIFQRFYRADPSRAREQGGTGLGLAIAQAIMHLHGGTAGTRSDDRAGEVTFWLRFPGGPA